MNPLTSDRGFVNLSLAVVLLTLALTSFGCSMTPAQRLSTVLDVEAGIYSSAAPAWSGVCKVKAEKCVAAGVQKSSDCQPWVDCQAALKKYHEARVAFLGACEASARLMLMGDAGAADKALVAALVAFRVAGALARAEGLIGKGGN